MGTVTITFSLIWKNGPCYDRGDASYVETNSTKLQMEMWHDLLLERKTVHNDIRTANIYIGPIYVYNCDFLFVCLSVCLFVCLSVCLFVCLSVCLFVCLSDAPYSPDRTT